MIPVVLLPAGHVALSSRADSRSGAPGRPEWVAFILESRMLLRLLAPLRQPWRRSVSGLTRCRRAARKDLLGVTSIVRALGLKPACYDRLLDFFHSPALDLNKLNRAWCALVFRAHPGILRVNGRPVLAGDGIKVAKAGRKMPGVKKLHQESESNNKPEYITFPEFLATAAKTVILVKFLRDRIDLSRAEGTSLAA